MTLLTETCGTILEDSELKLNLSFDPEVVLVDLLDFLDSVDFAVHRTLRDERKGSGIITEMSCFSSLCATLIIYSLLQRSLSVDRSV